MNREVLIHILQAHVPNLLAVYAFGSRITGTARPDSDLDLAILVAGYAEPLALFNLAGNLSDIASCSVDLLDLHDAQAALLEAVVISEETALDTARAGLLADSFKHMVDFRNIVVHDY